MAKYQHPSMTSFIAENTGLKCTASGCTNTREWTSKFCRKHGVIQIQFGTSEKIPFRFTMIKTEIEQVTELLSLNRTHTGFNHFMDFIRVHMQVAGQGSRSITGWQVFKMMDTLGADPEQVVIRIAALFLFHERDAQNARRNISTDRALHTLIGRAMRNCTPRWTTYRPRLTHGAIWRVGKFVWKEFGPLLIHLARSVESMLQAREDYKKSLVEPFTVI